MRNIATIACAMLVLGVAVQRASADELPNLKDPTMISAGHALFLEKQCAHCHGEDGAGGVNLTRRLLDAKGYSFRSPMGGRKTASACRRGVRCSAIRRSGRRPPTFCRSANQDRSAAVSPRPLIA